MTDNDAASVLLDRVKTLPERFRALFTLKNINTLAAREAIAECFTDPSALLKHECAYCLGQMQATTSVPVLTTVLKDPQQDVMVRHEAGEALGAIGDPESLSVLEEYSRNPIKEIAETCEVAIARIKWLQSRNGKDCYKSTVQYTSVDPAPPLQDTDVNTLRETLLDESLPLFERYRALFALRNDGSQEAVVALAEGLKCSSALFRHEIAYVLGQVRSDACIQQLIVNLRDVNENPMVRHECAEALGSIATEDCVNILRQYLTDSERVVKESCEVALDISEYENSDQFQLMTDVK